VEAQGNELSAREESLKKGGSSLDELRNKVLQPAENQRTTPSGRMKGVFKPRNLATDCHGPFPKPGLTPYPRQVFDLTVELRKEQSRRKVLEQKFENVRLMPQVRDCSCKTFWPNRLLSAPMLAWKLVRSELTWAAHRRKLQWIANDIWRARCVRTWRNT
jgi:hypothetical protein